MILLLSLALMAAVLTAGGVLLAAGLRSGDRPGETTVLHADVDPLTNTVRFTVHNPGCHTVLVGASVRRRSLQPSAAEVNS